ncbi:Plant UBX domain-containing protein 2 [Schistosoma japonicum]|nr:Plant UBX domain-containing protein 2 [Schistosoma japonicum]
MDNIVKFFKQKNVNRKFSKLGEGHRLNDGSVHHSSRATSKTKSESTSRQQMAPSSKSVEAAMSRLTVMQAQDSGSQTVHTENSTQFGRNMQNKPVGVEYEPQAVRHVDTDKPVVVPQLLFWCPNLFGDTVVGSRDKIEQAIQNYLTSESTCNINEATVLMLVRGIERSKLPPSSNIPLSELPSISEIKENRKQNIIRILQNLISAPENPMYRRLRASNKLINDLLSIDGLESFLTVIRHIYALLSHNSLEKSIQELYGSLKSDILSICNFKKTMLPVARPSEQTEGAEQSAQKNSEDVIEKEVFYQISEEDASNREHLEKLLNLFVTADPILPELYRDTKVYRATGRTLTCIPRDHLPDEFFCQTKEEFRKYVGQQHQIIEESGMLLTKAMRERLRTQNIKSFRYAVIRIRFPDNLLLQGTFYSMDKLLTVRQWISECLAEPYSFRLYAPPSIQTATLVNAPPTVHVELTDDHVTLNEIGLAPSSLLNVIFDDSKQGVSAIGFLRSDLAQSIEII